MEEIAKEIDMRDEMDFLGSQMMIECYGSLELHVGTQF
jgi:hypothetical protein